MAVKGIFPRTRLLDPKRRRSLRRTVHRVTRRPHRSRTPNRLRRPHTRGPTTRRMRRDYRHRRLGTRRSMKDPRHAATDPRYRTIIISTSSIGVRRTTPNGRKRTIRPMKHKRLRVRRGRPLTYLIRRTRRGGRRRRTGQGTLPR